MSKKKRALFLSYDGMTDPLGQSQVLSYLKPLSEYYSFDLISYEKPGIYEQNRNLIREFIGDANIAWHPLQYHKSPPILSTLIDIRNGWQKIHRLNRQNKIDLVHARGYISAINARRMKRQFGTKLLFDMRGWWADEKKESGLWDGAIYKPVYNYFKKLEKSCFLEADRSISLTYAGRDEIVRLGFDQAERVAVIPTCVNLEIFKAFNEEIRKAKRTELGINENDFVLIYAGALGGYYRTDVILDIFKQLLKLKPNASLILLTRVDHKMVQKEIQNSGAPPDRIRVEASEFVDVHKYLVASDLGLIIYDPKYSALGRSPTKMGEYWACGLPVMTMRNVGDLNRIIDKYPGSGVQFEQFEKSEFEKCLQQALWQPPDKAKFREYATDYFDVRKGVERYKAVYDEILG